MRLTGKITETDLKDIDRVRISAEHHKIPRVWMVAADNRVAKIFRKNNGHLEFLGEAAAEKTLADLTNDTVGRSISAASNTVHHKYEPHMAERNQESIAFTQQLAQWLDTAVRENACDRLVIAAAPQTLGNLRKSLSKRVQKHVTAEINKDLTKHPEPSLRAELSEVIPV
jgi:protein required for attachment to host cells